MGGAGPIPANVIWDAVDRFGLPAWASDAVFSIDARWLARQRKAAAVQEIGS